MEERLVSGNDMRFNLVKNIQESEALGFALIESEVSLNLEKEDY